MGTGLYPPLLHVQSRVRNHSLFRACSVLLAYDLKGMTSSKIHSFEREIIRLREQLLAKDAQIRALQDVNAALLERMPSVNLLYEELQRVIQRHMPSWSLCRPSATVSGNSDSPVV